MTQPKRGPSHFSLFGLILTFLGVMLLLHTLGVVEWSVWGVLWRFWPVVLILIGINTLWGRRSPWLMPLVTAVVLVGIVAAAVLMPGARIGPVAATFSQPLEGVTSAEVEIDFGAGRLEVGSLPADSPNLAEGKGNPGLEQDFQLRNGTGDLRLRISGRTAVWPFTEGGLRLEADLHPTIPLDLAVKTGASVADLDLTDLKVTRLRLETGASRVDLRLPATAGTTEALVKAGAARVTITIPIGVAARISESTGVGSFEIDQSRFPKVGGVYESTGYATAANRVDLRVESGVASVEVK